MTVSDTVYTFDVHLAVSGSTAHSVAVHLRVPAGSATEPTSALPTLASGYLRLVFDSRAPEPLLRGLNDTNRPEAVVMLDFGEEVAGLSEEGLRLSTSDTLQFGSSTLRLVNVTMGW